jgi:AbrB family looped-hinge helix DNA binding protein
MTMFSTTRISSKGQVVIPEEIRKRLNLREGTQFVVVGEKDVVVLKAIPEPAMDEFDMLVQQARLQAKQAGLKRSDVNVAIARARGRK